MNTKFLRKVWRDSDFREELQNDASQQMMKNPVGEVLSPEQMGVLCGGAGPETWPGEIVSEVAAGGSKTRTKTKCCLCCGCGVDDIAQYIPDRDEVVSNILGQH